MQDLFDNTRYVPKNKSIHQLEADWRKKYEKVFDSVKREWQPVIRDFMRDETGLSMHQKRAEKKILKDTNLNFDFVADTEWEFFKLIDEEFPDLDFNELIANRELQTVFQETEKFYQEGEKPTQEFIRLKNYVEKFLKDNDIEKVIEKIFKSKSSTFDIFGSYTYASGRIAIYYIPLILFARLKQVSLEYCLVTTLVHEVGHAFHHSGKDRDGTKWFDMPSANINIKEGLAQYYTERFIEAYANNFPQMETAYKTILSCQGGPYRVHETWAKEYKKEHVKQAMTVIRRTQKKEYSDFQTMLKQAKDILK
jgi:hypothetical protein